jgi:hypothetical protein
MGDKICYIGPLQLDQAHLVDSNTFENPRDISLSGFTYILGKSAPSESFLVYGTNEEMLQLYGLCNWDEIFWLDTSTELDDGGDFKHKGWYLISADGLEFLGPDYAQLKLIAKCISSADQTYFQQDYTQINQLPYDYVSGGLLSATPTYSYYYTYLDTDGKVKIDTALKSVAKYSSTASIDTSAGNVAWNWKESIYASGTAQAKNNGSSCGTTNKLVGSGYKFNIPTVSKIVGTILTIRYANNTPSSSGCSKVHAVTIDGNAGYYSVNSVGYSAGTNTNSLKTWTLGTSSSIISGLSSSPAGYNSGINVRYWATVAPGYTSFVDYYTMALYYRYTTGTYTIMQPASSAKTAWGSVTIGQTIPSGCSIKWNVYDGSKGTLLLSNQSGSSPINLSSIPHVNLKIVATLTANGTSTPTVNSVGISES